MLGLILCCCRLECLNFIFELRFHNRSSMGQRRGDPWSSPVHVRGCGPARVCIHTGSGTEGSVHAAGFGQLRTAQLGTLGAPWNSVGQACWDLDPVRWWRLWQRRPGERIGTSQGGSTRLAAGTCLSHGPEPVPEAADVNSGPSTQTGTAGAQAANFISKLLQNKSRHVMWALQ